VTVAELFGWAGAVLIVARTLPQAWHLARYRNPAGVSRFGILCWLGNDIGWLVYGLRAGLAPLWVPSLALLVVNGAMVLLLLPGFRRGEAGPGLAWVAVICTAAWLGQGPLALALIGGSATSTLPHAWRALRSPDLSGVSRTTWRIALADGVLWGVYGFSQRDPAILWYSVLVLLTGGIVLWRIRATRETPPERELQPI
jgi:uncharacterized protein with PQ loop repeat